MGTDEELLERGKTARGFEKEQAAERLLLRLHGSIMTSVNVYRAAPIPLPVLELEAKRIALEACADYQAGRGATLATYVTTTVRQRLSRYVTQNQNVARMPEHIVRSIGPVQAAERALTSRLHRDPTTDEIADHLAVPVTQVSKIRTMMRRDLSDSGFENLEAFSADPNYERSMLAYYSLAPEEKLVFDYSTGAHGQPKLRNAEMAQRMNLSPSRVSQLKAQVATKLKQYVR